MNNVNLIKMTKNECLEMLNANFIYSRDLTGFENFTKYQNEVRKMLELSNKDKLIEMAEQQLLGFFSAKTMNLREMVNSINLTKEEWKIIKTDYSIPYISEYEKNSIDLCVSK